jgi:homocysteine S-methyltransferase
MEALTAAGVDLIVLETFSHIAELSEALAAAHADGTPEVPLVVQVTVTIEGTISDGPTIEELLRFLTPWRPDVIGCNCSEGPASIRTVVKVLVAQAGIWVSAQPSAGLPQRQGAELAYPLSAEDFGEWAAWALESGVRVVGGCCGTTPNHIRAVRAAVDKWRGRTQVVTATAFARDRHEAAV